MGKCPEREKWCQFNLRSYKKNGVSSIYAAKNELTPIVALSEGVATHKVTE